MSNEEFQKLVLEKLGGIEADIKNIKADIKVMKIDIKDVKDDIRVLKGYGENLESNKQAKF